MRSSLGLLILLRLVLLLLRLVLLLLILIRHIISSCKVLHKIAEFISAVIFCADISTLFTERKIFCFFCSTRRFCEV